MLIELLLAVIIGQLFFVWFVIHLKSNEIRKQLKLATTSVSDTCQIITCEREKISNDLRLIGAQFSSEASREFNHSLLLFKEDFQKSLQNLTIPLQDTDQWVLAELKAIRLGIEQLATPTLESIPYQTERFYILKNLVEQVITELHKRSRP